MLSLPLTAGSTVRYARLGAGTVIDITRRMFEGENKEFAVIQLPHQEMTVQLPVEDEIVKRNLHAVASEKDLRYLLKHMEVHAEPLPRTWDVREAEGKEVILNGGPEEWVALFGSYSVAEGSGVKVASSDKSIVSSLRELLAAELCCAAKIEYQQALNEINNAYEALSELVADRGVSATHFGGVETETIARKLSTAMDPAVA